MPPDENTRDRPAIVFHTHLETPRILEHFRRLKAQAGSLADVFLCVHAGSRDGAPLPADFRVSEENLQRILPTRYQHWASRDQHWASRGDSLIPGFTDLAYMPALLSPALAVYRHIWLVEYDVDYSGDWADFFATFSSDDADLLGTTLYPRQDCAHWPHWSWFEAPVAAEHHYRSFVPIMRLSQRMLACYLQTVETGEWRGHTEAILPAIASSNDLVVRDVGGCGPLTPPHLRGKNYVNVSTVDGALDSGTMIYRPVQHRSYFHEQRRGFIPRHLYHPVKVDERSDADAGNAFTARPEQDSSAA